jgi:putative addiction module component (TIGR02574 family)
MSTIVEDIKIEDIKKLSVSERIELVENIWNSIAEESRFSPNLSGEEREELHRRYAAHQADLSTGIPWSRVRAKLFSGTQR